MVARGNHVHPHWTVDHCRTRLHLEHSSFLGTCATRSTYCAFIEMWAATLDAIVTYASPAMDEGDASRVVEQGVDRTA